MYCNCFPILPNRLAYPEHIPTSFQATPFYSTADDFFIQIKNTIANWSEIKTVKTYQKFVAKYDWSNLATDYDNALEKVCQH